MQAASNLLAQALRQPAATLSWPETKWDLLIRQARRADLLARLSHAMHEHGVFDSVPAQAKAHLVSADIIGQRHAQAARWEVRQILQALAGIGPVTILKGAAYLMADLPTAAGRIFSDIDILVPKARLNEIEAALRLHGWINTHHDEYDQRYYREWMHELPPMMHMTRQSVLDVHHSILPQTTRARPDPQKLMGSAIAVGNNAALQVLAPVDMVLHSATHLFYEGELDHGLRDMADLDSLFRHFGSSPSFWPALVARAQEMELTRPLFYALRYASLIFATPVPASVMAELPQQPGKPLLLLMDILYGRALAPMHASCDGPFTGIARTMLYVRAHWLRMPSWLLIHHLLHKAFLSPKHE